MKGFVSLVYGKYQKGGGHMKRQFISVIIYSVLAISIIIGFCGISLADNTTSISINQIQTLQKQINTLEKKVKLLQNEIKNQNMKNKGKGKANISPESLKSIDRFTSFLKDNHIGLGVSSGYFYSTNTGESNKDKFMISNFLLSWDYTPQNIPVNLSTGMGGTSTPSLLDNPYDSDSQPDIDIEYADFTVTPMDKTPLSVEMGLLQPNAGYEDTYTFNNKNITVGVLASQQPYNAYGLRVNYSLNDNLNLYVGYYKNRKDEDEYSVDFNNKNYKVKNAWETGIAGSIEDIDYALYYYQLNNFRKLLGISFEKDFNNLYLAFDMDYWNWDTRLENYYGSKSSIGGSIYISPSFGKFEFPLRLEYIHQGESKIYIDSEKTKNIYSITLTPTYHFSDSIYLKLEGAYINAKDGFENNEGKIKDSRYYISSEIGVVF